MILIGLGSNLPTVTHGNPLENCEAALSALAAAGVTVLRRSRWYESAPIPASDQPWFVNGVAAVTMKGTPEDLLVICQRIESHFGRARWERNAPRTLDLDLLAWEDRVIRGNGEALTVPHPRLHERSFVLYPLAEIAPDWRHPVLCTSIAGLIRRLTKDQQAFPLENKGDSAPGETR